MAQTTRPAIGFTGDPRMGVCTHFAQGWDAEKIMPEIEKSGFGWIRDDLGWDAIETKKGEYHIPDQTLAWIRSAHAHHLRLLLILMSKPYLEITYRKGKPFAAYLYLDRRPGDKADRTEPHSGWLIDFTADGRAIGVEFTQVSSVDLAAVNSVLAANRQAPISSDDLQPLLAA